MGKRSTIYSLLKSHQISTDLVSLLDNEKKYHCVSVIGKISSHIDEIKNGEDISFLIVEINFKDRKELELIAKLIQHRANNFAVIVTANQASLEDIRHLMRIGVMDFLPQPILKPELLNILEVAHSRLDNSQSLHSGYGSVFTFMKAGGGSGSTTLALQMAYSLMSPEKKNYDQKKVCYLDFDIQFGNAALFLDLDQKHSIQDVIENLGRVDGEYLKSVMTKHSSGLCVLTAPEDILPLDTLTPEIVELIIDIATEEFDHVIIDLPMPWTMWTNSVLANSDRINLVMQLTVKAIRQSRRILDMISKQGFDENSVNIVANRYQKSFGNRKFIRKTEEAIRHPINDFVSNEYAIVSKSQDLGELIPMVKKRTTIEKQVRSMAVSSLREINSRLEPQLS